jgi:hypothetical protein
MTWFKKGDAEIAVHDCEIVLLEVYSGKGKGTGTKLVQQAEDYLRNVEKCHMSYVYCTRQSKGFWKNMGYTPDGWSNRWWLSKTL